jgi:hypothetical protein
LATLSLSSNNRNEKKPVRDVAVPCASAVDDDVVDHDTELKAGGGPTRQWFL